MAALFLNRASGHYFRVGDPGRQVRTVLEFSVVFRSAKATHLSQSERRQWDSYFWHGPKDRRINNCRIHL